MLWDVVQGLGMFTIGAGVVGYVAKHGIKHYFDTSLNKYQAELEKEKLRFSELHTTRAEVTAELYERFVEFEEDMRKLTDLMQRPQDPSEEEQIQNAAESGNKFQNYYMKNKILFPTHICETVEDIIEETRDIHSRSRLKAAKSQHPHSGVEDLNDNLEMWKRVTEDDIPELKEELESHFRELLGVELEP